MKIFFIGLMISIIGIGGLFAQPIMFIDDPAPETELLGSTSYFGLDFTPKGHIHVLYVFVQFEGDNIDENKYWNRGEVPRWADSLFYTDTTQFSDDATDLSVSNYYYQNSKLSGEPLYITGETLDTVVTITPNEYTGSLMMFNDIVYDSLSSMFPNRDWSEFDLRTNSPNFNFDYSNSDPDSVIDYIVIQYRWFENGPWLQTVGIDTASSGGIAGVEEGSLRSSNGDYVIGGEGHCHASSFSFLTARTMFTHEVAHNLFEASHYGATNGERGAYDYFNLFWGSMHSGLNLLDAASAWERYILKWFDFKEGFDVSENNVKTNPYILGNFTTTNDALRVQLDENNYLWLEYHDGTSFLDQRKYITNVEGTPLAQSPQGLYAYITSAGHNRESDLNLHDNFVKVLDGEGNFNYSNNGVEILYPDEWWNKAFTFKKEEAAPYSGYGKNHYVFDDFNNDGILELDKTKNFEVKPILREGPSESEGEFTYANFTSSTLTLKEYKSYTSFSNPPLVSNSSFNDYAYLNRVKIYASKNTANNEYWVTVVYADEISNDVTMQNKLATQPNSNFRITNSSTVSIKKTLMPNSTLSDGLYKPSKFLINNNSTFTIEENSELIVFDDSELILGDNVVFNILGSLRITENAKLVVNGPIDFKNSEIILEDNSQLVLKDGACLKNMIISGTGKVIFDQEGSQIITFNNVDFNVDVELLYSTPNTDYLNLFGEITFRTFINFPNFLRITLLENAIVNFEQGVEFGVNSLLSDGSNVECNINNNFIYNSYTKIQGITRLNINYSNMDFVLQYLTIENSNINVLSNFSNVNITDVNFDQSSLSLTSFSDPNTGNCVVENNQFQNSTASEALRINDFNMFSIKNNTIENNHGHGIAIYNSGSVNFPSKKIEGNIINNNQKNDTAKGIIIYNSAVEIYKNTIHDNDIGIALFHNSIVSVYGASRLTDDQKIFNNNLYQVYTSGTSWPWKFEYNEINETNSVTPRVYNTNIKATNLVIENNCWGVNFDPRTDLYPYRAMDYEPVWDCGGPIPDPGDLFLDPAQALYSESLQDIAEEDYSSAYTKLQTIVEEYPNSSYAADALKTMTVASNSKSNYNDLINYFQTNTVIQGSEKLKLLVGYIIAELKTDEAMYNEALSFYEGIISNPPSEEDYVYALIDAARVYNLIEANGDKAPENFKFKDLMPKSKEEFRNTSRKYVDGLVKIHKIEVESEDESGDLINNPLDGIFNIYPNPVTSTANVIYKTTEISDVTISIFDVTGKRIYEQRITAEIGIQKHQISVKDIENGIYFVKVTIGNDSETKRIVINQ